MNIIESPPRIFAFELLTEDYLKFAFHWHSNVYQQQSVFIHWRGKITISFADWIVFHTKLCNRNRSLDFEVGLSNPTETLRAWILCLSMDRNQCSAQESVYDSHSTQTNVTSVILSDPQNLCSFTSCYMLVLRIVPIVRISVDNWGYIRLCTIKIIYWLMSKVDTSTIPDMNKIFKLSKWNELIHQTYQELFPIKINGKMWEQPKNLQFYYQTWFLFRIFAMKFSHWNNFRVEIFAQILIEAQLKCS